MSPDPVISIEGDGALTVPQFLSAFPLSRSTFYKLVRDGDLRLVKAGRRSLVPKASARQWWGSVSGELDGQ